MKRKIGIWNNYIEYSHNKIFDPSAYGIGEDLGYPIINLKNELEKKGYTVETLDMDSPENFEKIIFIDYPDPKKCCCNIDSIPKDKKYLVLTECEMIYDYNKDISLFSDFEKIFTYNDEFVKKYHYIKLCMSNKIKKDIVPLEFSLKKDITLIAGNKTSDKKGELYSERLRMIKYLEKFYAKSFEFYGTGWDNEYTFKGNRFVQKLNHFSFLKKILTRKHRCYKGRVSSKLETLRQYKFAICYENCSNIEGYITEKIWDCFFAGCLPVYLGAPNVTEYIPENTFVDRKKFTSDKAVIEYLINMSEEEYDTYIHNIRVFLNSDKPYIFSAECFADTLIKELAL